jgi:hypothetical protein
MEDKVQKCKRNITSSEPCRIYLCHVLYYLLVMLECIESIKLGLKNIIGKCEQIILKSVILLKFIDYNGLKKSYFVNRFWMNLLLFLISIVTSITFLYNFKRDVQLKPTLALLWHCRWHSLCLWLRKQTGRDYCKRIQSSGWVAGMDNMTAQLKDGVSGGETIATGPEGHWGIPTSELQPHDTITTTNGYCYALWKLYTKIQKSQ